MSAKCLPIEVNGWSCPCICDHCTEVTWAWFLCPRQTGRSFLLGLDFLETNNCYQVFSRVQLKIDSHNFVPLFHKQFDYDLDNVSRVFSTETLSVLPGHTKLIPAHIPNYWKRPPIQICALFQPQTSSKQITKCLHQIFFWFLTLTTKPEKRSRYTETLRSDFPKLNHKPW